MQFKLISLYLLVIVAAYSVNASEIGQEYADYLFGPGVEQHAVNEQINYSEILEVENKHFEAQINNLKSFEEILTKWREFPRETYWIHFKNMAVNNQAMCSIGYIKAFEALRLELESLGAGKNIYEGSLGDLTLIRMLREHSTKIAKKCLTKDLIEKVESFVEEQSQNPLLRVSSMDLSFPLMSDGAQVYTSGTQNRLDLRYLMKVFDADLQTRIHGQSLFDAYALIQASRNVAAQKYAHGEANNKLELTDDVQSNVIEPCQALLHAQGENQSLVQVFTLMKAIHLTDDSIEVIPEDSPIFEWLRTLNICKMLEYGYHANLLALKQKTSTNKGLLAKLKG